MITELNGKDSTPPELLMYWIRERYRILTVKSSPTASKPYSQDPVFQTTYFCNVRREDDKVTKWVREFYSPHVDSPMFEYNILLARFLNWPDTLEKIGFQLYDPYRLEYKLEELAKEGKIWGNAYVITTHGIKMPKLQYLCRNVLPSAYRALESYRGIRQAAGYQGEAHLTCALTATLLQRIEGVGSFLAGQIVADLKNTPGHPLYTAEDKATFVVPGPGSLRGVDWFFKDSNEKFGHRTKFQRDFLAIRAYVDEHWPAEVPAIDNQDLQNCLCEFDKYMRVRTGTGRSKRRYNGS